MVMNAAQQINQTSGECEYYTPALIIEAAREVMGGIDLDPASSVVANARVMAGDYYGNCPEGFRDGLRLPWLGRVWMNHPFSREGNRLWIGKLVSEVHAGRVKECCCITYACTSEAWFTPLLLKPQCYLVPRTNYLLPDGTVKRGVTKGSVVTYFGVNAARFTKVFRRLGVVKVRV